MSKAKQFYRNHKSEFVTLQTYIVVVTMLTTFAYIAIQ